MRQALLRTAFVLVGTSAACSSNRNAVKATIEDHDAVSLLVPWSPRAGPSASSEVEDDVVVVTYDGDRFPFAMVRMAVVDERLVLADGDFIRRSFALDEIVRVEVRGAWSDGSVAEATAVLPAWVKVLRVIGRAL